MSCHSRKKVTMNETKKRNIVSWTNAGKRQYGENHWFWAVWEEVEIDLSLPDILYVWGGLEPTAEGFCSSEKNAQKQAWNSLTRKRACRSTWSRRYLDEKQQNDARPNFSRCSCGKNKWFWIVWEGSLWLWDEIKPLAKGFGTSPEECEAMAMAKVGPVANFNSARDAAAFRK